MGKNLHDLLLIYYIYDSMRYCTFSFKDQENMKGWTNAGWMLGQRRRCSNIRLSLVHCLLFQGGFISRTNYCSISSKWKNGANKVKISLTVLRVVFLYIIQLNKKRIFQTWCSMKYPIVLYINHTLKLGLLIIDSINEIILHNSLEWEINFLRKYLIKVMSKWCHLLCYKGYTDQKHS